MDREKTVRPFGWRDKVGYMFGDFGNDFTFLFASTFLMIFYTKVLGISMGLVGTLFLTARCIDAFTDVTMGRIVDRMHPKKDGRFRPWLRRMCAPVAISSFLMYQSSLAGASMTVKVIYMFVTYILWGSIFYTSINIPYGSMASVLSADSDDRAALSTYRSVGNVGGTYHWCRWTDVGLYDRCSGQPACAWTAFYTDRRDLFPRGNRLLSVVLFYDHGTGKNRPDTP